MDLNSLLSFQTLFLAMAIGVIVALIRRPLEFRFPKLRTSEAWGKLAVPSASVLIGALLAMVTTVLPAEILDGNLIDRALHGGIAGFLASYVFRGVRGLLRGLSDGDQR